MGELLKVLRIGSMTSNSQGAFDLLVDARGLVCPMPLVKARQALMVMDDGQTVCVLATDPAAPGDFEAFCEASGHELCEHAMADGLFKIVVRKRA
ncbi:MAG: sulfurtransferase TusA family protein [Geminicoccaceae bacterium]